MSKEIKDIILIIDDDISVRDVLVMMIEQTGYNVLGASSLKNALEQYKEKLEKDITLIMLDYSIPNENFFETVKIINKDYSHIKLCVITGALENSLKEKIIETSNVCKFITKPVKIGDLQQILDSILQ